MGSAASGALLVFALRIIDVSIGTVRVILMVRGQRLKAVVVKRDGKRLSADDVKKYVKSNLAGYKAPRDVVFVAELPRTSTGKVLKRELMEGAGEP